MPRHPTPKRLAEALQTCQGCELYADATQAVPGAGPTGAAVMLVGEQPGDQEDLQGQPFVGPAGRLLDSALSEAGIDPETVYRTNAVKHFRWEKRASNRLHKKPGRVHVAACGPWLLAEIQMVQPVTVVPLGATAGQALFGPSFRVGASRGVRLDWQESVLADQVEWAPDWTVATAHPSSVLRSRDRDTDFGALVADLRVVAELVSG